ncbi:MAG TPA: HD domain-containing phosphohydrolase [Gemmatimonadales bacterium]|nr:HD domain-containing phosphohydrolase [Gemmatimonadales bacterium]
MARVISAAFLRTRVGRRILLLFTICAIIPILVLGVVSYRQVTSQLNRQAGDRAREETDALQNSVSERLLLMDVELQAVATTITNDTDGQSAGAEIAASTKSRFASIAVTRAHAAAPIALLGRPPRLPTPDSAQRARLGTDHAILVVTHATPVPAVLLARPLDDRAPDRGTIWGQVETRYLWLGPSASSGIPPGRGICAFDATDTPLFCSHPNADSLARRLMAKSPGVVSGVLQWKSSQGTYLTGFRNLFLKYDFGAPDWTVTVSESMAGVLAPIANLRSTLPLTLLLTLWVVLVASNIQIRRTTEPLLELQDATRRVARREFGTEAHVESGDEFQDLARSFNTMAHQLGRQFDMLTTITEIDRQVLSTLDTDKIVETVMTRMHDVLASDQVAICVRPNGGDGGWVLVASAPERATGTRREVTVTPDEIQALEHQPAHVILEAPRLDVSYLRAAGFTPPSVRAAVILPLIASGQARGVIALGYRDLPRLAEDDLAHGRQLADQVAVALANSRLVAELDALNLGTLTALAKAIDAKSSWTAGHSERVTALSDAVALELGLPDAERDILHRGGLLHDIGKIGIPGTILDKASKLTADEMEIMRGHVTVGAQILSPIGAYAPLIPIVLYHHERMDGSGYPEGLGGTDIPFTARLLAVPDVFDALTSDRPYRTGWERDHALEYLLQLAGTLFDTEVVRAFASAVRRIPADVTLETVR